VLPCPACGEELRSVAGPPLEHWACAKCGGRAVLESRLRDAFPASFADLIRVSIAEGGWRVRRRCPLCAMHLVGCSVPHEGKSYALDLCDQCSLVWFDRGEHEAASGQAPAPPPPDPDHDRPKWPPARARPAALEDETAVREGFRSDHWSDIPAVLGLPVPEGDAVGSRPWVTLLCAGAIAVASVVGFIAGVDEVVQEHGLVPAEPFRHGGFDWISSIFLHSGPWHLLSNLYFLVVFGSAVEGVLRPGKYAALLALAALAGKALYAVVESGSEIPSVGASGGISGALVYWALAFPRARVRVVLWRWVSLDTWTLSARTVLWIWFALQAWGVVEQVAREGGGVNALAHVGGAAVGAAFWFGWRRA
jgi:membrane associated rhomboid family serine protease